MPKLSVLLAYYERPSQLKVTLDSYIHWYAGRDYEYVLINDGSKIPINRMIEDYSKTLNIRYEEIYRDVHLNPGPVYRYAAEQASSDVLFLTNPENVHFGDVLGKAEQWIGPNRYVCFSCLTLNSIGPFTEMLNHTKNYYNVHDAYSGYIQHSVHSNRMLHFASAIMKDDWNRVGGFSPEFDSGCAYEDNDFVETLIRENFEFYVIDEPGVGHIPHIRTEQMKPHMINRKVFYDKWGFLPRESYPEAKVTVVS